MSEVNPYIAQFRNWRSKETLNLLSNSVPGSNAASNPFAALASQRSSDTIKLTHLMLKIRLTNDLDSTIANYYQDHPDLKGKVHIAINTDKDYSTEVVPKSTAQQDDVGYYTGQTPSDPAYQGFKHTLETYFKRNLPVIRYLQANPESAS